MAHPDQNQTATQSPIRGSTARSRLGIDVIHTVHQDCMKTIHFDTNHINHLTWETPEDLRTNLQLRIERVLRRGPVDSTAPEGV